MEGIPAEGRMSPRRSAGFIVPAILYTTVSIVSTQLPLLNYLGYEFSLLIAIVASLIAGYWTIISVRKFLGGDSIPGEDHARRAIGVFTYSLRSHLSLLFIPLVVSLVNGFFVKNCSLLVGFGFFVLLPVVSVLFSCALGFFCACAFHRLAKTVFTLAFITTLLYAIATGYFTPAIYSYNFFYGYFPGLTYDEALGIHLPLVLYRMLTLLIAGLLVWLSVLILRHVLPTVPFWRRGIILVKVLFRDRNLILTTTILITLACTYLYRADLGFETHEATIRKVLDQRAESENFVISYTRTSFTRDEIRWVAAEHEFLLSQVRQVFNIGVSGKIESYIYPSSEVKQRLIGTGTTNIAKPWNKQLHVTAQTLDGTLKHELVHVVAAPFGVPVIKASLSTGLVEGLAMAIEWDWGNRTPHEYAAAMKKFDVGPDIGTIMLLTGFAAQSSSVSYVLAGSFCRFLIDRFGIRKMTQLYRRNNYEEIYGRTLNELIEEWHRFLTRFPVEEGERDVIDVLFRQPPIYKKVCPRVIGDQNLLAGKKFSRKEYDQAAALFEDSFREGKGYDALNGYLTSSLRLRRYSVVTAAFDTVIMTNQRPSQYLPILLVVGDAFLGEGKIDDAIRLYDKLRRVDVTERLTEAASLRALALQNQDDVEVFRTYFLFDGSDTLRSAMLDSLIMERPQNVILRYLKGRTLHAMKRFAESHEVLQEVELADVDPYLESLRLRMVGYSLFRLAKFQEAKIFFWSSLNYRSSEVAINRVNEWIERCEWMSVRLWQ